MTEFEQFLAEHESRVQEEMEEGRQYPFAPRPLTDEEVAELSANLGPSPEEIKHAHEIVVRAAAEGELTETEGNIVWDACVLGVAMPTMRYKLLTPLEKRRGDAVISKVSF